MTRWPPNLQKRKKKKKKKKKKTPCGKLVVFNEFVADRFLSEKEKRSNRHQVVSKQFGGYQVSKGKKKDTTTA
jgi:hypothetical protein